MSRLKGTEKRADRLGTLGPRNDPVLSSLGSLFVPDIPDVELKKPQPETSMDTEKILNPPKTYSL